MIRKAAVCVAAALAAATLTVAPVCEAKSSGPKTVPDELLVRFKAGTAHGKVDAALSGAGAKEKDEIEGLRIKRVKVASSRKQTAKSKLLKNPNVEFVEENFLAGAAGTPNDPYYSSQWHLNKIAAPGGWDTSVGSETVDIAIIDSGIDLTHSDLAGKLLPGYSFIKESADVSDVTGHGTAVAGTAAAITNNSAGVAGVSWTSPIMPLAVTDPTTNTASYYNIARAITYAVDHGAKVINISIGGSSSSSTLDSATAYAWNNGAVIFASAMNNNVSTRYYPAACANVVAVASTNSSDGKSSFSNYGDWIILSAPGENIFTTNRGGGYGGWNGTSFASPVAAGTAALVLSANPLLSNRQVVDILKQTADDLGTPGFDIYFGNGRVNAAKAITAALNAAPVTDSTPPVATITSPAGGTVVNKTVQISVNATDNMAVTAVDLLINGATYATTASSPFIFAWDSTTVTDGNATIVAVARDAEGNIGSSQTVIVKVQNAPDTTAPTLAITSPAAGNNVGNKVVVTGTGADNVAVTKMDLYLDGTRVSSSSSSTISYTWNSRKAAAGQHLLTLKGWDAAGNVSSVSITVVK